MNDTSNECHGFEIEPTIVTAGTSPYCYDYNHGTPRIYEDTTSGARSHELLRALRAILTNGVWSAYTAVPTNPISPTDGHQFTNPSLNFGGETFWRVGYYGVLGHQIQLAH